MREPTGFRSFSLSMRGERVRSSGLVNWICQIYGTKIYVNLQFCCRFQQVYADYKAEFADSIWNFD